ncbi:MAG: metal-dependent transcriptional regulator [Mesonia hippocampi]|uniref:Transcriptional regulator MntR n=1 Tax=Mesonia hippocampi TaxID=1628250 RepID=A0A840ETX3_9FLAO|nr:metal-dependent transcriptional regulator [Mesonia hippocampi]MBB4118347.1 DtxR family Mn-dependent transcriptional regulator [Mesonia hippocampi]
MTLSEENYLKAIFHLEKKYTKGVPTNAIAEEMDTKASSATDMIKRLSEKDLIAYKPYQGAKLTKEGSAHAVKVIRKHRLWESFLVDKLDFSWDEVHEVAEQLEHIKSEKLIKELDKFLGYPKTDPHGDPIPDENGKIHRIEKTILSKLEVGQGGVCIGVKDSSSAFLKYLDKHHISLGKSIKVLGKESFDNSMLVKVGEDELTLSSLVSTNLYIKIVK